MEKVEAYKVWAIYAEFDDMAPNTEDLIYLSDAKLALQLARHVNENPREWNIAVAEGFEGYKRFRIRQALLEIDNNVKVHDNMDNAVKAFTI